MSQTTNLQLNKHDNVSTNENSFDIENYLNANWEKIDANAGEIDDEIGTLHRFSGRRLSLSLDKNNYKLTAVLRNADNEKISESQIDLPLEDLEKEVEILSETIDSELEDGVATGESITVNDSARAKAKLDVGGNTSQEASPSPEYPQEVQVVKGSNTIKVSNKNWFDYENGIINANGQEQNDSYSIRSKDYINCSTNKQFTFSKNTRFSSNLNLMCRCYDENKNFIKSVSGLSANELTKSITFTDDVFYFRIVQFGNSEYNPRTTNYEIQCELGLTATSYVEHEEQTITITLPEGMEMCKIGDYKDEFVKDLDTGKWYKNKEINKIILDGTEAWRKSTLTDIDRYWFTLMQGNLSNYQNQVAYCNSFTYGYNTRIINKLDLQGFQTETRLFINFSNYNETTIDDFKVWLSANKPIVYYVLVTPEEEEITDETLISQLDKLYEVITYYGQTNVTCEGDGLSPIFTLNYKKSNRLRLENIENRLAQIEQ